MPREAFQRPTEVWKSLKLWGVWIQSYVQASNPVHALSHIIHAILTGLKTLWSTWKQRTCWTAKGMRSCYNTVGHEHAPELLRFFMRGDRRKESNIGVPSLHLEDLQSSNDSQELEFCVASRSPMNPIQKRISGHRPPKMPLALQMSVLCASRDFHLIPSVRAKAQPKGAEALTLLASHQARFQPAWCLSVSEAFIHVATRATPPGLPWYCSPASQRCLACAAMCTAVPKKGQVCFAERCG